VTEANLDAPTIAEMVKASQKPISIIIIGDNAKIKGSEVDLGNMPF